MVVTRGLDYRTAGPGPATARFALRLIRLRRAPLLVIALALTIAASASCTSSPAPQGASKTGSPTSGAPPSNRPGGSPAATLAPAPNLDDLRGELVYSIFSGAGRVYLRDLKTSREIQIASFPHRGAQQFAWSPDGRRIALYSGVDVRTRQTDIEVMDSDGSNLINVTSDPAIGNCTSPSWSPDGKRILFACVPAPANPFEVGNDPPFLYVARADGTGGPERLTNFWSQSPAWSPDGTKIAFQAWQGPFPTSEQSRRAAEKAKSNYEIYVMSADGTGKQQLTNTPQNDENPEWSPDGTQIAFDSERDTTDRSSSLETDAPFMTPSQIYVMNADGTDQKRITNDTGQEQVRPHWIRQDLIAFFYYDYASSIEGMAFIRPQGSATMQIPGPYPNFDIYLTGG